jgi:hypothetical protein
VEIAMRGICRVRQGLKDFELSGAAPFDFQGGVLLTQLAAGLPLAIFRGVGGSWSTFRIQWAGSMRIVRFVVERREL